jgi:hypothetical protein
MTRRTRYIVRAVLQQPVGSKSVRSFSHISDDKELIVRIEKCVWQSGPLDGWLPSSGCADPGSYAELRNFGSHHRNGASSQRESLRNGQAGLPFDQAGISDGAYDRDKLSRND